MSDYFNIKSLYLKPFFTLQTLQYQEVMSPEASAEKLQSFSIINTGVYFDSLVSTEART